MLKELLSVFLQSNCSLCGRSTSKAICQDCEKQVKSCQIKDNCRFWQGNLPLFVWGNYQGRLKQAIAALKYQKSPQIGELLGCYLGEAWLNSSLYLQNKKLSVIPIPLHPKKLQERGFNQAELIAQAFCQITGYKLLKKGLIRQKETQAMFNLSFHERENNLKNAFLVAENIKSSHLTQPILLIDDIYTTGTTAQEAAKVLKAKKILIFGIAAIAKPIREKE
jgi:ComF family protein